MCLSACTKLLIARCSFEATAVQLVFQQILPLSLISNSHASYRASPLQEDARTIPAMDEDDDFDYNDLDGVVFDEEVPSTPEQGLEEPQTGAVVVAAATAACAYGSDYESDDLATHSPAKKPKTEMGQSGGGRKKGSTSTRHGRIGGTMRPSFPASRPARTRSRSGTRSRRSSSGPSF